MAADGLSKGES